MPGCALARGPEDNPAAAVSTSFAALPTASLDSCLRRLSNNVAEVYAMAMVFAWILAQPAGQRYCICYDSKYAAFCVRQQWRAKSNLGLMRFAAALFARADSHAEISWHWVRGHDRCAGNEEADKLAKAGASGTSKLWYT